MALSFEPEASSLLNSLVMGFSLRGLLPLIPAFRFQPGRQLGDVARCIARPDRLVQRRRVYLTATGSIVLHLLFQMECVSYFQWFDLFSSWILQPAAIDFSMVSLAKQIISTIASVTLL